MKRILLFTILAFTACKKDKKTGPVESALTGTWVQVEYVLLINTRSNYTFNTDHTYSSLEMENTLGESGTYQVKTTADPRIVELNLTKNGGGSYPLTIEKISETAIRVMANGGGAVFRRR